MDDCRNAGGRRPPAEIMRVALMVDYTGKVPFVDTAAAARFLALSPHSLKCYRSLGGGPPSYKFGKFVRYSIADLETWVAERRHDRTSGDNARLY